MIIKCENCSVMFNLDETLLKPTGSKVRCSQCKHIFTAYPPATDDEEEDIDLADLEEMMEDDTDKDSLKEREVSETITETFDEDEDETEELDLSGLDDMLEDETEEDTQSEDLGLDLDLDLEPDEEEEESELDLEPEVEPEAVKPDEELDLDLDLDMEPDEEEEESELDLEPEIEPEAVKPDEELDLELDLDMEPDEEEDGELELELDVDETSEDELELDLDLEEFEEEPGKALEDDILSTKSTEKEKDQDDLDLELELDIDEPGEEVAQADASVEEEEIDLAELEQTLEMELLSPQDEKDDGEPEDLELELSDEGDSGDEQIGDDELLDQVDDLDVSDIEQMLDMDEGAGELDESTDSDEMELEFDIDDQADQEDEEPGSGQTLGGEEKETFSAASGKDEGDAAEEEPEKTVKTGTNKALVVIIIFIVLAAAAVGVYFLLQSQGMAPPLSKLGIPYVSDLFAPGVKKDMGRIKAVQSTIKGDFINNSKAGKLFIIKGEVENSSSLTHNNIKVTAKLYSKGGVLAKSVTVYAGNIISQDELKTDTLESINKRLLTKTEAGRGMGELKPGGRLPFTIVVPNLPNDLEEYRISVAGSTIEKK